jgi:sigma-B regulation protein RsbU (phosphoserine phosphatase)
MITATIKFQIYDLKKQYLEPGLFLEQLNNRLEQFFRGTENDYFVTAFYGVLDLEQRTFLYSNAGHSAPGLYTGNRLELLDNDHGLPLGILPDMPYDQKQVQLNIGDELFLYTDGIFELALLGKEAKTCSSIHELFDTDAPVTILQLRQLKEEILTWVSKEQIADDINYISIELLS